MATTSRPIFFTNSSYGELYDNADDPAHILHTIMSSYYVLIVLVAVPTQSFVIRAILRRDQLKTPIHRLLLQLAIIDLINVVFSAIYFWTSHWFREFYSWKFSCNLVLFTTYVSNFAGIFFCAFIGFMLFTKHLTYLYVNVISAAIWISAMIVMQDLAYNPDHRQVYGGKVYGCSGGIGLQDYLDLKIEAARFGLIISILIVLPLLHKVVRRSFWLRSELNDMLMDMIMWQVALTLGTSIFITEANLRIENRKQHYVLHFFHYFFILSMVYRPFLYVWRCRHFRTEFNELRVVALVQPETFLLRNEGGA